MKAPTNYPSMLARIGRALYGELWQSALARDLEVNNRTIRRWTTGETAPALAVWPELRALLRRHREALQAAERDLDRALQD